MQNIKYTDSAQFRCLEDLSETSMELYLVHAGKEYCLPNHTYTGRREEYIIHFILSGKGKYTVAGNSWELTAGSMFLLIPGEVVSYSSDSEDPWTYTWVGFNGLNTDAILKDCGFSQHSLVRTCHNPEYALDTVNKILDARHLTHANDLRRRAHLMMLLANLIEEHDTVRSKSADNYDYSTNAYVQHAVDYITWAFRERINVSDVAAYIGISRTYLNHVFQKELGISAQRFLIDFRMHKSANLLLSTTLSISEIAKMVGYDDSLTFSKAFKKKFGSSPSLYRNHHEQMDQYSVKQ